MNKLVSPKHVMIKVHATPMQNVHAITLQNVHAFGTMLTYHDVFKTDLC